MVTFGDYNYFLLKNDFMKKILGLTIMSAIAFSFLFTSCNKKKDYTCVCTIDVVGNSPIVQEHPLLNVKKKNAKKSCDALSKELEADNVGSCKLK